MQLVKPSAAYGACVALALLFVIGVHLFNLHADAMPVPANAVAVQGATEPSHPSDLTDFGNGALLRQPAGMQGMAFGFSYPSMRARAWPGEMGISEAKKKPGYIAKADRFPVFLTWLSYQPWDIDHMPPREAPRRPLQILRDGAPDNERQSSPFADLDVVVNPRLAAEESRRRTAPAQGTSFIGARGISYELLVNCSQTVCNADVYSERSRFAFRLMFPSESVAHTIDLIKAVDNMIASWAPTDSVVATHWRDPASAHPAPVEEYPPPPDCGTPSYTRRALTSAVANPASIAVNPAGDVFFTSTRLWDHMKVYKVSATSISASTPRPEVFSDDLGTVVALTTDAQGGLYAAKPHGLIVRAKPDSWFPNHFFDFATSLKSEANSLKLDTRGDAFYIDFQSGDVIRRTSPQAWTARETVMASGFDRAAGLAVERSGAVYVVDAARRLIERLNIDGTVQILPVKLRRPGAVALDSKGNLFVLDNGLAPIQRISPSGEVCAVTRELRAFDYLDLAVDGQGRVFATDLVDKVVDEFAPN